MTNDSWQKKFWWQWIAANSLAELLGLGTVAILGFLVITQFGEPHGLVQSLGYAVLFIILGGLEGLVVGAAQARILRRRLPSLQGWVRATVIGAIVAWALGMMPSTIMSINPPTTSETPPEISEGLVLLLAAGLGFITGPILALFQWFRLRKYVRHRAAWWLPANAVAWMLGMPIIFIGAHMSSVITNPGIIAIGVAMSLFLAGAVVGAVHGRVLIWLLS